MDQKIPDSSKMVKSFLENSSPEMTSNFLNLEFIDSTITTENLFLEGKSLLSLGDVEKALDCFDQALKQAVDKAGLSYRQGLALWEYGQIKGREKALLLANKKWKTATFFKPDQFCAWHMWGRSLLFLGQTFKEKHYFTEGASKLQKALILSSKEEASVLSELHHNLAVVSSHLATYSKEPSDWHTAVEHFQKAVSYIDSFTSGFWDAYGFACLQLSYCINDIALCVKAIQCFKYAISRSPSDFSLGWKHLAQGLRRLYEHTHDPDHLAQAIDSFKAARQSNKDDVDLVLEHADLLLESGKRKQNIIHLKSCIDKASKAYRLSPQSARALALWGEALALMGQYGERLDLLLEGENKFNEVLDIDGDHPAISYHYGQCLNSFGRYYNDVDYHYQAIEKFQEALSQNRTLHRSWHAIGMSYYQAGILEENEYIIEKGVWFLRKAIVLAPYNTYYHIDLALSLSKLGELSQNPEHLLLAINQFEQTLLLQKNAVYLHPDWLFHYAKTLDLYGDYHEETGYYTKAIELLGHILMINPNLKGVYYQMGLSFSHLGELSLEIDNFYKALHYFKLAAKEDEDNDSILLDLGITLMNISQSTTDPTEEQTCLLDAEAKLTQSAKLGSVIAYYQLACLCSLTGRHEEGIYFLTKADDFDALPSLEEIVEDEWLDPLRETLACQEFLREIEKRASLQE